MFCYTVFTPLRDQSVSEILILIMAKQFDQKEHPTHEEIARRAYTIFEQGGRVPGQDIENWLKAEAQLMADRKAKPETRQGSNGSGKTATRHAALSTRA